jgi:hypothetical protein
MTAIVCKLQVSQAADTYSFGVMLLEMAAEYFSGTLECYCLGNQLQYLPSGGEGEEQAAAAVRLLISRCLCNHPDERVDLEELTDALYCIAAGNFDLFA